MIQRVRCVSLLLLLLGLCVPLGYALHVSGIVSGHWSVADSPFIVDSNLTVPTGNLLTIDPGVSVLFEPNITFLINGVLNATGSSDNPIIFNGNRINTIDSANVWNGIRFENSTGVSLLNYTIIRSANNPIHAQSSSIQISNSNIQGSNSANNGVSANQAVILIRNTSISISTFGGVYPTGIYSTASRITLYMDTISVSANGTNQNSYGIITQGGAFKLDHSTLSVTATRWAYGISASDMDSSFFNRNVIKMNSRVQNIGIQMTGMGWQSFFWQNTIHFMSATPVIAIQTQRCRGIQIRNNIFFGASLAQTLSHGLESGNDNIVDWDYNLLYGFNQPYTSTLYGIHDLLADPALDPITFVPLRSSPVINAGDSTLPRDPDGTVADIGAKPFIFTSIHEWSPIPESINLRTYPNPFNSTVRISVPITGKVEWRVYNRIGRIIDSGSGIAERGTFISEWKPPANTASGWYTLELLTEKGVARRNLCYLR